MKPIFDKNNKQLKEGDVIDLHQTVNGQNKFIVMSLSPLDIRYQYNVGHLYEYDKEDLFKPDQYSGEVAFEILYNIYDNRK